MDTIQRSIEIRTARPIHPGLELALYLLGGLGLMTLASAGLFLLFQQQMTIWFTLVFSLLNMACFGGSFFALGVLRQKTSLPAVGLTRAAWRWRYLWMALLVTAGSLPLRVYIGNAVQTWVSGWLDGLAMRGDLYTGGSSTFSWLNLAISFLSIAVLPALSEELYFRGLIHTWMQPRMALVPRVLLSACIFSLAHSDAVGVMVAALILGIINALAYERTKSLWLPIFIHFFTNGLVVLIMFASMTMSK